MKKLGAWMLAALIVAAAAAEVVLAQSGGNSGGSQSGASSGSATGQSGTPSGSGGDKSGDTRREGMPGSTSAAPGSESTSGPSTGATMPGGSAATPTPSTAAPSTPGADVVAEDTETIRQAQIQLQSAGFSAGSANGIMDEQTRDAIRQFQQAKGLQVTGALDQETQAALKSGAGAQNPANQVR